MNVEITALADANLEEIEREVILELFDCPHCWSFSYRQYRNT